MSRSSELRSRESSACIDGTSEGRESELPPVLSQRRPAVRAPTATEPPRDEERGPDTIPAPMWFIEE